MLTREGKYFCLRVKPAHLIGHLPPMFAQPSTKSEQQFGESTVMERKKRNKIRQSTVLRALRVLPWLRTAMTSFAVPDLLAQFRRLRLEVGELALQLLANKGGDDAEVVDNLDVAVIEAEKLLAGA
jgi:hypothetical protein